MCIGISFCFNLHFPNDLLAIIFSGKSICSPFFYYFYWVGLFSRIKFWQFWIKSFLRYVIYKYFLHVYDLSFHSLNSIVQRTKVLKFWWSPVYQIFLLWVIYLVLYQRNICLTKCHRYILLFSSSSSVVSCCTFRSMIHANFCRVRYGSKQIFLHINTQLFQY